MTPKEKARLLIDRFKRLSKKKCDCLEYSCTCFSVPTYKAKEMALIVVDELIKETPKNHTYYLAVKYEINSIPNIEL